MAVYLDRLPVPHTPAPATQRPREPAIWHRRTLGLLGLIVSVCVAATVFGHLLANKDGTMRTPDVPAGCLEAAVEPLGRTAVAGRAALCVTETGTRGILDLEHLEPGGQYVEWLAYFDRPWACSMARVGASGRYVARPCTLSDLDGPDPPGALQRIGNFIAGANGAGHVEGFVRQTPLAAHAQVWLLVSRVSSALVQQPDAGVDVGVYEARAIFDLP